MKLYTVHIKPGVGANEQRPVFVKEGFHLAAFLFTFFWAFYHRLWIQGVVLLAVYIALVVMAQGELFSKPAVLAMQIGFELLVGYQANDWRRGQLARRGYVLADVTAGDNLLRAEQRYFERYLAAA